MSVSEENYSRKPTVASDNLQRESVSWSTNTQGKATIPSYAEFVLRLFKGKCWTWSGGEMKSKRGNYFRSKEKDFEEEFGTQVMRDELLDCRLKHVQMDEYFSVTPGLAIWTQKCSAR